jgi:hypothetical protein
LDVAGEQRDHDPRGRGLNQALEHRADAALGASALRHVDVGAVAEEQADAFIAQLADARFVGRLAIGRVRIEVEVTAVEDDALRGSDRERAGLDDGVRDAHGLDLKRPNLVALPGRRYAKIELVRTEAMLEQALASHAERVGRAPNRHLQLSQ